MVKEAFLVSAYWCDESVCFMVTLRIDVVLGLIVFVTTSIRNHMITELTRLARFIAVWSHRLSKITRPTLLEVSESVMGSEPIEYRCLDVQNICKLLTFCCGSSVQRYRSTTCCEGRTEVRLVSRPAWHCRGLLGMT